MFLLTRIWWDFENFFGDPCERYADFCCLDRSTRDEVRLRHVFNFVMSRLFPCVLNTTYWHVMTGIFCIVQWPLIEVWMSSHFGWVAECRLVFRSYLGLWMAQKCIVWRFIALLHFDAPVIISFWQSTRSFLSSPTPYTWEVIMPFLFIGIN